MVMRFSSACTSTSSPSCRAAWSATSAGICTANIFPHFWMSVFMCKLPVGYVALPGGSIHTFAGGLISDHCLSLASAVEHSSVLNYLRTLEGCHPEPVETAAGRLSYDGKSQ